MQTRQIAIFGIGIPSILADYTTQLFNRIDLLATALNRTGISLAEQLIAPQCGDVLIVMMQKSVHREGLTTFREARRLGISVILLTSVLGSRFSKDASIATCVSREDGEEKMPPYGMVLLCLEMTVWSVASVMLQYVVKTIKRISDFR